MRSQADFDVAMAMVGAGRNDCDVARATGIPRSTIREWRIGKGRRVDRGTPCVHDFARLPIGSYAYLLGVYLGDGCLSAAPRGVWKLRLTMDSDYPVIIRECRAAIEAVMPGQRAHCYAPPPSRSYVEISMYSKHWPCLFPQHGPGRKHSRRIVLEPWQHRIVGRAHEGFLRGLLHSDGCRIVANDRGRSSPRYHFSNRSEDIKRLYCASLDALGIPWTRPCDRQIAVYRRSAVRALDQFVGPKR